MKIDVNNLMALRGVTCRCGATKKRDSSFCRRCFHLLPAEMRQALYLRLGSGYDEAYNAAAKFLDYVNAAGKARVL